MEGGKWRSENGGSQNDVMGPSVVRLHLTLPQTGEKVQYSIGLCQPHFLRFFGLHMASLIGHGASHLLLQ